MNEIEKILKKIGSNKVNWVKLGDVCTFTRGKPLSSSDTIPGNVPVVSGGQKPSFYHNRPNRVRNTITVAGSGASAGFVSYWEIPIWVADAFTVDPYEKLTLKYVYYFLKNNQEKIYRLQKGAGVPHVHGNDIAGIKIPVPKVPIQNWIVLILDSFTTLIDKMKHEVELRKKQMEYYREKLLLFDEPEADFVKIKDLFDTKNGYTPSTKNPDFWTDKGIPWVKMEDIRENGTVLSDSAKHITMSAVKGSKLFNANSIILATSATIGVHALVTVPHLSNQRFTNIYPKKEYENKIDMKYAYYYFFKIDRWCKEHVTLGNFAGVNMSDFYDYDFPLPPLSTQRSIVSTLDAFEQYISKLERLITLREKQYAYYREKLLTFE